MQLIRGLNRWQHQDRSIITIGNFDGMHRGHQAMLAATRQAALKLNAPATLVSFDPLPHEYFSSDKAPPRLQGLRDRYLSVREAGMDRLLLLKFDQVLAAQSAEDFIKLVLVDALKAKHLVIGDDFKFGHQRRGDFDLLKARASRYDYTLEQSITSCHNDTRISSTAVRSHLLAGELDQAAKLLGRPYRITGRVIHGEKLARQLGYPTANVALHRHRPPLRGVFAVWATEQTSGRRYAAVANLGERPTIGGRKLLLEVHAFDAKVQWYGKHLAVDFMAQLRKEKRFDSLDELKSQIQQDAQQAKVLMKSL
ncbi:MAG: bifunctional riboflavin kinase/FAD synthetase [Granulosicoccus sp.]|nr:bifunctional riboflavin kinase/FAD synthetase [Granulosicoccus sp.]